MSTSVEGLLDRLSEVLRAVPVPFMVVGSFASSAHGMPRSTQDLDIVIDPPDILAVDAIVRALPKEAYYVDGDAARDAFRRRSMFNVVDMATGWKADLIVRKDRPFSREELARRVAVDILGVRVDCATAEDTIISKLEWSVRSGGSERQRRDIAGIVAAAAGQLDQAYVERWVAALRLEAEWAAARATEL